MADLAARYASDLKRARTIVDTMRDNGKLEGEIRTRLTRILSPIFPPDEFTRLEKKLVHALAPGAREWLATIPSALLHDDDPDSDLDDAQELLAAAAAAAAGPFAAAVRPSGGGATTSTAAPEGSVTRLCEHANFVPLGPVVCSRAPAEHPFSHLRIDHTITRFAVGSEEEKAVRLLYYALHYAPKRFPCKPIVDAVTGDALGPFCAARELQLRPPDDPQSHREILIFGATQLSKTPEAAVTAWDATFVDGTRR